MKIIYAGNFDIIDKEEIKNFIQHSTPKSGTIFEVSKIKIDAGWVYISVKNNEKEFAIKYSDFMTDTSDVIEFFAEIVDLKGDIACILDYEGSDPIIFVQSLGDNVRFLFAHDYELFLNDDIDNYDLNSYKIECDIIISKKDLLKEFYKVLFIYVNKMSTDDEDKFYSAYKLESGQKYLNVIKNYLDTI